MKLRQHMITFVLGLLMINVADWIARRSETNALSNGRSIDAFGRESWIVIGTLVFGLSIAIVIERFAANKQRSKFNALAYLKTLGIYLIGVVAGGLVFPARM